MVLVPVCCDGTVPQQITHVQQQHQAMAPRDSRDNSSDNNKLSFPFLVFLTLLFSYHCHCPSCCHFPFHTPCATAAPCGGPWILPTNTAHPAGRGREQAAPGASRAVCVSHQSQQTLTSSSTLPATWGRRMRCVYNSLPFRAESSTQCDAEPW